MTTLRAWSFRSDLAAQRAARALAGPSGEVTAVDDAAILSWPGDRRRPLAWQARDLGTDHRLSGAFWGLLFAQLFLLPIGWELLPNWDPSRLDETLAYLGLDEQFVHAIRAQVVPGTSALFVLDSDAAGNVIDRQLADDTRRLQVVLSDEQAGRIHAAFDDD
jgi:uncharacterized membrane protein